jgi:hypothetical protein
MSIGHELLKSYGPGLFYVYLFEVNLSSIKMHDMNGEAKKLALIEKLLLVSDDAVLAEVDAVLSKKNLAKNTSFKEFAGSISDENLSELERIIEEGCEQTYPDDWK